MTSFNQNEENNNNEDKKRIKRFNIFNREEINIIKRTLENNTHEVLEDKQLKSITSWRKSKKKFYKALIFNIITFGILHWISLHYPLLYIKLYCNPWRAKECDFFLVENIYGEYTLCEKIYKKPKFHDNYSINSDTIDDKIISPSFSNISKKSEYNFVKNLTYSFKYNSMNYEYNLESSEIIPVYMDLSKLKNKEIINFLGEGISTYSLFKKFEDRYGKNEYQINTNFTHLYFKNVELPSYIIIFIAGIVELILKDYFSFISKIFFIIFIFAHEYAFHKIIYNNIIKRDKIIPDKENRIKVKRKYLIKDKDKFYIEIKNEDLLPGDILFFKSNDIVPCDCLIIEGECIVNQDNSTDNLDIFKKTFIMGNKEQFNYQRNQINILLHGMKIIKTASKIKNGYISALCLNIGPNTYKANQFSNTLYSFERNKANQDIYKFIGDDRKDIFISIICLFFLCILLGIAYTFIMKMDIRLDILKTLIFSCFLRVLFKSIMPVYFITHCIILIKSINNLKNQKIFCNDKSRLLHSYNINTIFLSKTNILCQSSFEINSFNPVYVNEQKSNNIIINSFKEDQYKEMNDLLLKYYEEYLSANDNLKDNSKNYKSKNEKSYKPLPLFLECLLSCNNLEKINNEIFGNKIESKLFLDMNWDMKTYDYDFDYNDKNNQYNEKMTHLDNLYDNIVYHKDKIHYIIDNKKSDIFPKNYYKIIEFIKKKHKNSEKLIINNISKRRYLKKKKAKKINLIIEDVSKAHLNSYKLRIYKRFIKNGTLNSSAIIYNFISKELRFMTKGIPEDILNKCNKKSLPENIRKTIAFIRMSGYIVIICATKLLQLEEYNDSYSLDYYMNNLTFCGFITLKNKLKNEISNAINDLKQFNCNLIINSGDNIYNCISAGFNSTILDKNKNIFVFDKDDMNKILIYKILDLRNIYENNNEDDNNNENKNENEILKKFSRQISSNFHNEKFLDSNSSFKYLNDSKNYLIKNNNLNIIYKNSYKNESEKRDSKISFSKKIISFSRNEVKPNLKEIPNNSKKNIKKMKYHKISSINLSNESQNKSLSKENQLESMKLSEKSLLSEPSNIKDSKNNSNCNQKNMPTKKRKTKNDIFVNNNYYYPKIFQDNKDLSNNCIYCINGKTFRFLYKNKNRKEYKYLLSQIHKNAKIFYNMSSIDKSLSVNFFREFKNSCICFIGNSDSDYYSIMSSNVGIKLDILKNTNSASCHFYSNESILCIKNIILEGKAIQENIIFLKIASIFCTMIINSFILCCFICHIDVMIGQQNLLEFSLIMFSITAFIGKSNNIKNHYFRNNNKLFICFYVTQIIGIFLIKLVCIYLLLINHVNGPINDNVRNAQVFCTFYFLLCLESLFSSIFIFNYNSFYRKNFIENTFFIFIILIFLFYLLILLTLSSSNYNLDILNITYFEFLDELVDSYSDRNKLITFIVFVIDFLCSFIYSRIVYFIFDKKSEKSKAKTIS